MKILVIFNFALKSYFIGTGLVIGLDATQAGITRISFKKKPRDIQGLIANRVTTVVLPKGECIRLEDGKSREKGHFHTFIFIITRPRKGKVKKETEMFGRFVRK